MLGAFNPWMHVYCFCLYQVDTDSFISGYSVSCQLQNSSYFDCIKMFMLREMSTTPFKTRNSIPKRNYWQVSVSTSTTCIRFLEMEDFPQEY